MSPRPGTQRRPDNAPSVLMQGRVAPDVRTAVADAAAASGVSVSYYLERHFKDILDERGSLPHVLPPKPQKETLIDDV